jgi:hypothetical protein
MVVGSRFIDMPLAILDRIPGQESYGTVSPIRVYDDYRVIVAGPAWDCHWTLALSLGSHTVHACQFSMEFFTSSRHGYVLTPV